MEELKKEKEQAEKFSDLQKELRYKKASKIKKEMDELNFEKSKILKSIEERNNEIEKLTETKNNLSKKIDLNSEELEKINNLTEELGGTEQVELNNQIEEIRIRINELKTEIRGGEKELKRIEERKQQLLKDIKLNIENSEKLKKDILHLNETINSLKQKLDKEKEKFDRLNNLDKERVSIFSEINAIEKEIIALGGELSDYKKKQEEFEKKKKLKQDLKIKEEKLKSLLEKDSTFAIKISNLKDEHNKLTKELHNLEGKKEVLFGLLKKGTRAILAKKDSGEIKGIHGLLYDLAKVDEKYAIPLKVAAGSRSDAIVVDNVSVAKECIDYLRQNKLGIATFLPLDKLKVEKTKKEIKKIDGVIGFAIDLIRYNQKYENVFRYILSDTLVVKDIETAKKVGINKYRMVTLDGDLIERSGAMTGGHRQKEVVGFKSEPINEKIKKLQNEISKINGETNSIEGKREELNEKIENLRREIYHINSFIDSLGEFDEEKFKKLKDELDKKKLVKEELEEKLKSLPEKVDKGHLENVSKKIEELQTKLNEIEAKKRGFGFELEIIKRDMERSQKLIKDLEKEKINFEKNINSWKKELEQSEKRLNAKLEEEKKFHSKLKSLYEKRTKINELIKHLEIKRARIDEQIEKIRDHLNNFKLKLAEINAKLEGKKTAMEEFSDITINEVKEDIQELEKQIHQLEIKISSFGAVNMRALDVYKEVEKEYNELKEKVDKLQQEKDEIIKVMNEVEEKKKEAFFETFRNVAKNFERVFSVLSPNGEGRLILENEEEPFEGGLDIVARPGGKKFISLKAMSGGEKTLTTLAFIFAVQEYMPSPFYIMDEVDAALDRENSERLGYLLSEYSKTSQFIVVTHNDSILAKADSVYGVHMNALGESQIVSVKLPKR